jgi:guanylate cyclase soluble subunit beta
MVCLVRIPAHGQQCNARRFPQQKQLLCAGDCYMATTGLLAEADDHAVQIIEFARAAQQVAGQVLTPLGDPVRLRVGIHSGRVISGIVGTLRTRYCLFGGGRDVYTPHALEGEAGPLMM